MRDTLALNEPAIRDLIGRGALFVVNHSAGKDSHAMMILVRKLVPDANLLVIHADLGGVEWPGNVEHIKRFTAGLPLIVCRNNNKTFMEMVERRGMFPSPTLRTCTSDLKRNPIEREIRRYLKAHPEFGGLIVNCMGMRAEESPGRSKLRIFKKSESNSKAGREWYDWMPIHGLTTSEVFGIIRDAGEEPHPAYAAGMSRLSCCFCIMASKRDLTVAAKLNPVLYHKLVELEKKIGHTLSMTGAGLESVTGIAAVAPVPGAPDTVADNLLAFAA